MTVTVALLALASAQAGAVVPAAPAPLEPNGPWVVEGSEGACMLTRSYGPDSAKITVGLQPLFTTPKSELIVLTQDRSRENGRGEATVTLSSGEVLTGTFYSYALTNRRRATRLLMPSELLAKVKTATSMTLAARPLSVTVRLARTAAAFAVFDECQRALFKLWNVDPAALAPGRAPVAIDPGRAYGWDQYPVKAMRQNIQGRVLTVLDIDAGGGVTGCRVVAPVHPLLDAATCERARRIRFTPGKDANGTLASSIYMLPVRWVLP